MLIAVVGCAGPGTYMAVCVPICDLRASPNTAAVNGAHDPLQETQLLYGERVKILEQREDWARIEALEQLEFTHAGRWQGYPGWVPLTALDRHPDAHPASIVVTAKLIDARQHPGAPERASPWRFAMGTRLAARAEGEQWRVTLLDGHTVWLPRHAAAAWAKLRALPDDARRRLVLERAQQFIGDAYYWGGRSPHDPSVPGVTGVDCSGLINLAHRAVGVEIPRDAHEQHLRARAVHTLQPADLIFLSASSDPRKITHVMLYAGDEMVIEAPGTGLAVRRISLRDRLGVSLDQLHPGYIADGRTVSFGSYHD